MRATISQVPISAPGSAGCPESFDAFYAAWEPRLRPYCWAQGFRAPDLDDLVQTIFLRLYERYESIDWSRADRYVWNHVQLTIKNWRRAWSRRSRVLVPARLREIPWTPLEERREEAAERRRALADSDDGPLVEDAFAIPECNDALAHARAELAVLPRRGKGKSMQPLFDELVRQMACDGEVNYSEAARAIGVDRRDLPPRLHRLRASAPMTALREDLRAA